MSREEEEGQENYLGEVPETLFLERGGFPPQAKGPTFESGQQLPPDIAYQDNIQQNVGNAPLGTVPQKTYVTTVFDARPINARDFFTSKFESVVNGLPPSYNMDTDFIVPNGYIAILRGIWWSFGNNMPLGGETNPPPLNDASFDVSILVNGIATPNFDSIGSYGVFLNKFEKTYILAESQQTITLRLTISPNQDGASVDVATKMRGNLLLKKGLPLNFEPGSL